MATYFGEVTGLSSRAVDDEDFENEPTYSFNTKGSEGFVSPVSCKLVIFAVGKLATSFTSCYILPENSKLLFEVKILLDKWDDEFMMYSGARNTVSKGAIAATCHSVSNEVILCDISQRVPEDYISDLCVILLEHIQAEQSLVLMSQHMSAYKSENPLTNDTSFLRSIATSIFTIKNTLTVPRLPSPNYISGFSAAFLTEYEIKKKEAVCFVNYVDTSELDSSNIQGFTAVLNERFRVKIPVNTDASVKLARFIRGHTNQSNLYT